MSYAPCIIDQDDPRESRNWSIFCQVCLQTLWKKLWWVEYKIENCYFLLQKGVQGSCDGSCLCELFDWGTVHSISKFERNQRVVRFPVVEHSRGQLYLLWVGNRAIVSFFLVRFVIVYVKLGATHASRPTSTQLCISFTILNSDSAIYDMPMPNKRVIWFALRQYEKFHSRKNLILWWYCDWGWWEY